MPRKAPKITVKELKKKIDEIKMEPWFYADLTPEIEKDLKKVQFDFENCTDDPQQRFGNVRLPVGYNMIGDLAALGIQAGGDWEFPVYFIIYWDGKKLRAYIPKDGNAWNYDTKQAIGNDEGADQKFLTKFYSKLYGAEQEDDYEYDDADGMVDSEKIRQDIINRINCA